MRRSGEHLLTLINDILDVSKIEAGRMTVEAVECRLVDVLADVESLMRARATEKGIAIQVEYQTSIPERVKTDPTRFRQILMNLVGNAIKFTDEGERAGAGGVPGGCDVWPAGAPAGGGGGGYGGGDHGRAAAAVVSAVHAGGRLDDAAVWRDGAGAVDFAAAGGDDGRGSGGAQRSGEGEHVSVVAADGGGGGDADIGAGGGAAAGRGDAPDAGARCRGRWGCGCFWRRMGRRIGM